ncbi:MAG: PLP-dependent aminotransferase family protein [Bryobacteraceae bacterium]|jgi:GntR family transcriptional regulator/MocR family aminotransferase
MRTALVLDRASDSPLHRQIYNQWRQGILTGRFRRAERVPSTRELSTALEVSRSTVTQAYDQLIAEGYLESSRGSGTFVCRELPDELLRPNHKQVPRTEATPPLRLSRYGAGLNEDFSYPPTPPGFIRFTQWRPDLALFPLPIWRKLVMRRLRSAEPELFDYADQAAGYGPLREEIAAYVSRSRAVRCTPEQVIIVNGSAQGIDLCVRLLLEPGDEVAIENPGYHGAHRIFAGYGARLRPARIDDSGIVIRDLGKKARLVYVTPSHQFPTGVAMSLARRLELIEWSRQHNAVLIEDDYDSEYRYSGPPLPSLQGLATGVAVIYIGTFSKVMFPSLRIGYVIAPPSLVPRLRRAKWLADRHNPVPEQAALADFISEGHLERHIRRMRRIYGERRNVLVESLERHFGDRVHIRGDAAGMHVLASFEAGDLHDQTIAERAAAAKVQLVSSAAYYLTAAPRGEFVLGFSSIGERSIREGIRRLAEALR